MIRFWSEKPFGIFYSPYRRKGLKHIKGDFLIDNGELSKTKQVHQGILIKNLIVHITCFLMLHWLISRHINLILYHKKNGLHIYADPPAATMKINNKVKLTKGRCRGKHRHLKHNIVSQTGAEYCHYIFRRLSTSPVVHQTFIAHHDPK